MLLLDGKKLAHEIEQELKQKIASKPQQRAPCLVAILTTDNPASHTYVSRKARACQQVGIISRVLKLQPQTTEELIALIHNLNHDSTVDGILVQLPLPRHIEQMRVLESVDPMKDVDGFHPVNVGRMLLGDERAFCPCTPLGIKVLLQRYSIDVSKKHVVIVGRSNIVGKPLACMLMQNAPGCNATVTVAHSHTPDLKQISLSADILVAACGRPNLITADMVQDGAVVIDVGINQVADASKSSGYSLVGDVDFPALSKKVSAITPVPGGVGPMTIAMLLQNTLRFWGQA